MMRTLQRLALTHLEHCDSGALADHETPPCSIEWSGRLSWRVVPLLRKTASSREARDSQGMNARLGTSSYHDICVAKGYHPRSIPEGMKPGGTSSRHGVVWAHEPMADRDMAGGKVD